MPRYEAAGFRAFVFYHLNPEGWNNLSIFASPSPDGLVLKDCFAGYDAAPAARRCGVARLGKTAAGIDLLAPARLALTGLPSANLPKQLPQLCVAEHSYLQKSANGLQRSSWE